jgi:hypothetical protein
MIVYDESLISRSPEFHMFNSRIAVIAIVTLSSLHWSSSSTLAQVAGSETHSWSGTLFDTARTDCGPEVKTSSSPGTCPVSICTANFGIKLPDGKLYKFDEASNPKAAYALRKSKKASKLVIGYWQTGKVASAITAKVTGTLTSDTLNLDSIQID